MAVVGGGQGGVEGEVVPEGEVVKENLHLLVFLPK
jgi:hypothetical protein